MQALSLSHKPGIFRWRTSISSNREQHTQCPILAKDFFIDSFQITEARAFGADAVLLMASVLEISQINEFLAQLEELNMNALVEVQPIRARQHT